MTSTEVTIFNCRIRLVLNEEEAKRLRELGVDPVATAEIEIAADYEIGELLHSGTVCPADCKKIARDLETYSLIDRAEVINDGEPC